MRKVRPLFILLLALGVWELIHLYFLFSGAEFLAGGDNSSYLTLLKGGLNPYFWDSALSFGGVAYSTADLFGLPFYALLNKYISPSLIQRILIYSLYFFRYIAFYKLVKYISKKVSLLAFIPAVLLFVFNPFESLNPFSLYSLMYSIYLPWSFYYFLKLFDSKKLNLVPVAKLLILSLIFSPIGGNIALVATLFIPQGLYLLFNIRKINKQIILNVGLYWLLWLFSNLWWIIPFCLFYFQSVQAYTSSGWFNALTAGKLYLNFRFLGQWAWYDWHYLEPYYAFSAYYDNFFVALISYSVIGASFISGFSLLSKKEKPTNYRKFLVFLALITLLLISGARSPSGFLYNLIYNIFPPFKAFREPFTKFGEIYVLAISVLFYLFLCDLKSLLKLQKRLKDVFVYGFVILLVVIISKPSIFGEHVWSKWNGNMRTLRVSVPEYWKEFKEYAQGLEEDTRLIALPRIRYGTAWNWPHGISSSDDMVLPFIKQGVNILRNSFSAKHPKDMLIDLFYEDSTLDSKYLAFLDIDYILQENDMDWRYAGLSNFTPQKSKEFIKNLEVKKLKTFSKYDLDYLKIIPNLELKQNLHKELGALLLGEPILSLYEVSDMYKIPTLYAANDLIYATGELSELKNITSLDLYKPKDGVYLRTLKGFDKYERASLPGSTYLVGEKKEAKVNLSSAEWSWLWPDYVSVDPQSFEYKLLPLKEWLSEISVGRSVEKRVDTLVWLAAKRVSELTKFQLVSDVQEILLEKYSKTMFRVLDILKEVPMADREDDYWGAVRQAVGYMQKSNGILETLGIVPQLSSAPVEVYSAFVSWLEREANPFCKDFCYEVRVSEEAEYTLVIDEDTYPSEESVEVEILKENTAFKFKYQEDSKGPHWLGLGNTEALQEGFYNINLSFPTGENLLSEEDWQSYAALSNKTDFGLEFNPYNIFLKPEVIDEDEDVLEGEEARTKVFLLEKNAQYKKVKEWSPSAKYKLSFDYYVLDGILGFALLEDIPNYDDLFNKLSFGISREDADVSLVKRTHSKKTLDNISTSFEVVNCDDEMNCFFHFEQLITPSKDALGAYLFVYAIPSEESAVQVDIRNVKIERMWDPHIALVKEEVGSKKDTPDVTYTKINPTKYQVHVKNAVSPYTLVFTEGFDEHWGLHYEGNPVAKDRHYIVNGYANSWEVLPEDVSEEVGYTLVLEYTPQRLFYIAIGVLGVLTTLSVGIVLYAKTKKFFK